MLTEISSKVDSWQNPQAFGPRWELRRCCYAFIVAIPVLFSTSSARAEQPSFMGLGIPVGQRLSKAEDVSADGSVVVGWLDDGLTAFRWSKTAGMTPVASGRAYGASADGSVVVGGCSICVAFRWTTSGVGYLGSLPGYGGANWGRGVSDDGSVVVGIARRDEVYHQAFRWTSETGSVGLGYFPGNLRSNALGVSGDGMVVVGTSSSPGDPEAFRWTSQSGMVGLGDLNGGLFGSEAWAASANGSVIVGGSFSAAGFEAFRWTSDGGMVGLGSLPGGSFFYSNALGVSADGSIVIGIANDNVSGPDQRAFIWDALHGMRNLREALISEYGLDLTGWTLSYARGISADGRTIAGYGTNPQGSTEAWVAYLGAPVPEPSTFALVAVAFAAVIVTSLRRRTL